jgi:hypothetical protein
MTRFVKNIDLEQLIEALHARLSLAVFMSLPMYKQGQRYSLRGL